jgi:hypothetical protein
MSINHKEQELRKFADLIISSKDYNDLKMKINGYRMGMQNRYGKEKRAEVWKNLLDVYK